MTNTIAVVGGGTDLEIKERNTCIRCNIRPATRSKGTLCHSCYQVEWKRQKNIKEKKKNWKPAYAVNSQKNLGVIINGWEVVEISEQVEFCTVRCTGCGEERYVKLTPHNKNYDLLNNIKVHECFIIFNIMTDLQKETLDVYKKTGYNITETAKIFRATNKSIYQMIRKMKKGYMPYVIDNRKNKIKRR